MLVFMASLMAVALALILDTNPAVLSMRSVAAPPA
jgi:hypothetical protein